MAKSHRTYDRKPVYVKQDEKWRNETAEEFRKKYGSWWLWQGVPIVKHDAWILRYRKEVEQGNRVQS